MAGNEREQRIRSEVSDFLNDLERRANRAQELLAELISMAYPNGDCPELSFVNNNNGLYVPEIRARKEKAILIGHFYKSSGTFRAVILSQNGDLFSADSVDLRQPPGLINTTRYLKDEDSLQFVVKLLWFPKASSELLGLIKNE